MSSVNTIVGNALQFTNDNKHVYAFSGFKNFDNTGTTLLQFNTNSEYIVIKLNCMRSDTDSLDSQHQIFINSIETLNFTLPSGPTVLANLPEMVVPPFSIVQIDIKNVSNSSTGTGGVALTGKAYMTNKVAE